LKLSNKKPAMMAAASGILALESHAKANSIIGAKLAEKGIHWEKKRKSPNKESAGPLGGDPADLELPMHMHSVSKSDLKKQ
jgi:hypothetical protein